MTINVPSSLPQPLSGGLALLEEVGLLENYTNTIYFLGEEPYKILLNFNNFSDVSSK